MQSRWVGKCPDCGAWDALDKVEWMARANLIGSLVLTVVVWFVAYSVR